LVGEDPFGRHCAGKHNEPACLAINPVYGPHRRTATRFLAVLSTPCSQITGNCYGHHLVERGLHLPTAGRPRLLLAVPRCCHTRRLLHDNHGVIQMHNPQGFGFGRRNSSDVEHLDHFPILKPSGHIGADIAVNHHVPRPHHLLHVRPTGVADLGAQKSGKSLSSFRFTDVMDCSGNRFHRVPECNVKRGQATRFVQMTR